MRWLIVVVLLLTGTLAAAVDIPSLAEGQWQLTGRLSVTACARGRCVTRRQSLNQSFEVTPEGGGGDSLLVPLCPDVPLPDDTDLMTFEPGRNGWLRVRVLDRRALVRFLRQCTGYSTLRLQRLAARVRVEPSGEVFELRESVRFTLVVRGVFVQASGAGRLFGMRIPALDAGAALAQQAPRDAVAGALARAVAAAVAP